MDIDEFDPFDVAMICCNCKYEGENYTCKCEQRITDIRNGNEKDCSQYCVYFKQQDWITREQEQFNRRVYI